METVNCNQCGSSHSSPMFDIGDFWLDRNQELFHYVRCVSCGLVYQNPRPSPKEMAQYYPKDYEVFQVNHQAKENFQFRYSMRRRSSFILRRIRSGKLPDVGCATGTFLRWLKQSGEWEVYGVEPDVTSAEAARQLGVSVVTGTLESAEYSPSSFDVVTMWDVIEHLHNPQSTLREVHRILKPNGILVMRLPNLDSFDARVFGKYWAGFDAPRHLFAFGNRTIDTLLLQAGFVPIEKNSQIGGYLNFVKSVRFALVGKEIKPLVRKLLVGILSSFPMRLALFPLFLLKDSNARGSEVVVVSKKWGYLE